MNLHGITMAIGDDGGRVLLCRMDTLKFDFQLLLESGLGECKRRCEIEIKRRNRSSFALHVFNSYVLYENLIRHKSISKQSNHSD